MQNTLIIWLDNNSLDTDRWLNGAITIKRQPEDFMPQAMFEWFALGGNNRKGGQSSDTCNHMCTDYKYWTWQLTLAVVSSTHSQLHNLLNCELSQSSNY